MFPQRVERRQLLCGVYVWLAICGLMLGTTALAELQNVEIGGSIEVRGNYYTPFWDPDGASPRIPPFFLPGRYIGPFDTWSPITADSGRGHSLGWIEQRTTLHADASFTDDVRAYIELDNIDDWGEDFRSDYITGADFVTPTDDDLEVYQAYIEANNMFDTPLRLRVGRQELIFGSEWLVGNNFYWDPLTYLSFDAIRLTYATDAFSLDAFWSKLAERFQAEEDGDVDFYGLYFTYNRFESITLDAYWFYLRDAAGLNDTNFVWMVESLEDLVGLDDYDVTEIHTLGLRLAGESGNFDFEAEAAYQWGNAGSVGNGFSAYLYGDDDAAYDAWAAQCSLGYTFDLKWSPYVYVGAEYYGGEDNRDLSFWEWLNPFSRPQASVSFNRLFSSWEVDWFLDGSAMSNVWIGKAGVSASPTDAIEVGLDLVYFEVLEAFDTPAAFRLGRFSVPIAPNLSFWTREGDDDLGYQTILWLNYAYSEDLLFEVGWAHMFTGGAFEDGAFVDLNGLGFFGGTDADDADYLWFGTTLEF